MDTDRRRTDSRERIREVALRLFTEQGYERTSLAQVADELGMTRAAVLHHYAGKDALLTGEYVALLPELDDLLRPLRRRPRSDDARLTALREFAAVLAGDHGPALVCAQVNEAVVRGLSEAAALQRRLDLLAKLIAADGIDGRIRARLAVAALVMAEVRAPELGGRIAARRAAALRVATGLLEQT